MTRDISKIVAARKNAADESELSRTNLIRLGDLIIAAGSSEIRPQFDQHFPPDVDLDNHVVITYIRTVKREDWQSLGNQRVISDLSFSPETVEDNALLPIYNNERQYLGGLNWKISTPGKHIIQTMVLPAAIILVISILLVILFIRRMGYLMDKLEQANRMKSAFLATINHEVRTPLNAIIGFSEILESEAYGRVEGEKNHEYIRDIKSSGERLLHVITDVLNTSRLEAGYYELVLTEVYPGEVIQQCADELRMACDSKDLTLTIDCDEDHFIMDTKVLYEVIFNILDNAVNFTEPKGLIHITGQSLKSVYRIIIRDNGPGMTKREASRALSLFGQLEDYNTRSTEGIGLGLPLVKRFMALCGGSFEFEAVKGIGTTVILDFPRTLETNDQGQI